MRVDAKTMRPTSTTSRGPVDAVRGIELGARSADTNASVRPRSGGGAGPPASVVPGSLDGLKYGHGHRRSAWVPGGDADRPAVVRPRGRGALPRELRVPPGLDPARDVGRERGRRRRTSVRTVVPLPALEDGCRRLHGSLLPPPPEDAHPRLRAPEEGREEA